MYGLGPSSPAPNLQTLLVWHLKDFWWQGGITERLVCVLKSVLIFKPWFIKIDSLWKEGVLSVVLTELLGKCFRAAGSPLFYVKSCLCVMQTHAHTSCWEAEQTLTDTRPDWSRLVLCFCGRAAVQRHFPSLSAPWNMVRRLWLLVLFSPTGVFGFCWGLGCHVVIISSNVCHETFDLSWNLHKAQ